MPERGYNIVSRHYNVILLNAVFSWLCLIYSPWERGLNVCVKEDTILFLYVCQNKDFNGLSASLQNNKNNKTQRRGSTPVTLGTIRSPLVHLLVPDPPCLCVPAKALDPVSSSALTTRSSSWMCQVIRKLRRGLAS